MKRESSLGHFVETPESRSITLPGLRLDFTWLEDRWTHALTVARAGDGPSLVRAVEGDAERDDSARVVSPAYQQIHLHEEGGVPMVLLVGQSGPHHFSASFAVRSLLDAIAVEVDVADRCRAEVAALACTYVVEATSGDLQDADSARASWSVPGFGGLAFEVEPPGSSTLGEAGRRGTQVQAAARIEPGASTHRCRYTWRFAPEP